jgi:hypothetical protein
LRRLAPRGLPDRDRVAGEVAVLGVAGQEARVRGADALDPAAKAALQRVRRPEVEELELDARAAGVEDEDGVGHQAVTGLVAARCRA